jgi:hypothetical protein
MPNREVHNYFCNMILKNKKACDMINEDIDSAVSYLGPRHRIVGHSTTDVFMRAYKLKIPLTDVVKASIIHIYLDKATSKNRSFKTSLNILEQLIKGGSYKK